MVAASWNYLMKSYSKLTARQSKQVGDNLFNRSSALETADMIARANTTYDEDEEEEDYDQHTSMKNKAAAESDQVSPDTRKKKMFSMKTIVKSMRSFASNKKTVKIDEDA
jgi:hypothetical protein